MISVISWLWRQEKSRAGFRAEHVNTWAAMVRRNLTMPHRIACVTDMPEGIDPSVEIIAPPGDFLNITSPTWSVQRGKPQCYRRLAMFRRDAGRIFGERIACMDLDCVIGGSLDPLFDRPEDLVLFKGTVPSRPYNGSMQLIRAGCRPDVFEDFSQEAALESGALYCGSDQAWLMHKLGPDVPTWGEDDGVFWFNSRFRSQARARARVVFFPGKSKPWDLAKIERYTRTHYRMTMKEAA